MTAPAATPAPEAPTASAPAEAAPSRAEALSRAYIEEELARMARYQAVADALVARLERCAVLQPVEAEPPAEASAEAPAEAAEATRASLAVLDLAFHRITRAACVCGARRAAMIEALRKLESGEAPFARRFAAQVAASAQAAASAAGSPANPHHPPLDADEAVEVAVEAAIKTLVALEHPDDRQAADRLFDEAQARLHEDGPLRGFRARPISATVGDLWAALGRAPDWPAIADAAWASEAKAWAHTGAFRVVFVTRPHETSAPPDIPKPGRRPESWAAPNAPVPPPVPPPDPPPPDAWTPPHEGPYVLPGELPPVRRSRWT